MNRGFTKAIKILIRMNYNLLRLLIIPQLRTNDHSRIVKIITLNRMNTPNFINCVRRINPVFID